MKLIDHPTDRMHALAGMVRDVAERHYHEHGTHPSWVWVSGGWMDAFMGEAGQTWSPSVVPFVHGCCCWRHQGLEGVVVASVWRQV